MKYVVSLVGEDGFVLAPVEVYAPSAVEASKKHPVKPLRHHEVMVEGGDLKEPEYYEVGRL